MYTPIDRRHLVSDLKRGTIEVIFDKIDGTRRIMRATLQARYLPPLTEETEHIDSTPEEVKEPQALSVWDVERGGWRSFRLDRVLSMQLVNSEH